MQSKTRAFAVMRAVVVVLFAVTAALAFARQPWIDPPLLSVAVFLLIAVACELLPVTLPESEAIITLTPIVVWAVVALFGPGYGVIIAFCSAFLGLVIYLQFLSPLDERRENPWPYVVHNSCVIGTTTGVGGLIYQVLGGPRLASAELSSFPFTSVLFPLVAALFAALSLDLLFYAFGSGVVESMEDNQPSLETIVMRAKVCWVKNVLGFLPSYLMFTPFAFVLAYLFVWRGLGFWGVLPILVPFFALRHALNLLMQSVKTYRQTITTLAMLMQKYHPYTRGHLKRVADLCVRLARELRLPATSQQWIWEAGLLHDIGKVGVSESILDKTEKLTDIEWETIKAHPLKSAEILAQLEFLDPLVQWVRYHHERVDGRGYPDGKREGEIPIEAEIIAVADAFDAMTGTRNVADGRTRKRCDACDWQPPNGNSMPEECPSCGATLIRVYREPMTVEQGINQLRYGVGTQFSPRVVRAFIRMMAREGNNDT